MIPHLLWWNKREATGVEAVESLAAEDPLVTSFGDGMVVVAMRIEPDGSYLATWTLGIGAHRTLPEVETFIAKVATYIIDEPIE